jgi:integrase
MAKKLTAKAVEQAKPRIGEAGEAIRTEIPDAGKPGLYLIIQPSGRKSWAVRYRRLSDGKPRKYTLPGFPSLATAHKLAQSALDAAAEGGDPAAEKIEAKRAAALDDGRDQFGKVAVDFINRYSRKENRSWAETARLLGLQPDPNSRGDDGKPLAPEKRPLIAMDGGLAHEKRWGKRRIQEIARRDLIELLDGIVDEGKPYAANRTLAAIRKLFNWCCERDMLTTSPCAGVKPPGAETSRDRILSDDEIRWLWKASEGQGYPFGPLAQLLLLTAQRRDEVAGMMARELDVDKPGAVWIIPRDRAKNDTENLVPLSTAAVEIIEGLPQIAGKPGFVFTTTGESHVTGYSRAKHRLDREMLALARQEAAERGADPEKVTIPRWTLHDLRRTAASGMARLGQPVHVVEAALNHRSGTIRGVAAVYNRYSYADEKRRALEAWGRFIADLVNREPAGNVVALRA